MPANVESMMYALEVPWHGLGTKVNGLATSRDAIVKAGLNWTVEKRKVFAETLIEMKGYSAIVRTSDNTGLGIVGSRYQPFQNEEAFDFFDEVVGEHAAMYETAGSIDNGRRIFLLAKLPTYIKVTRDDVVEKYLLLSNTHDGSGAIRMFYTPIRVVCMNTLNVALRGFSAKDGVSIRHTKNVQTKIEEAKQVLGLANKYYEKLGEAFQALVKVKYTVKQMKDLVLHLLPADAEGDVSTRTKNMRESIANLFDHGKGQTNSAVRGTAWAAYNAVTEFADHYRATRVSEGGNEKEQRLESSFFGSGRAFKQDAFDYIAEQTQVPQLVKLVRAS
jgi:phage/plasmid-like protein (TIGR03299 family)